MSVVTRVTLADGSLITITDRKPGVDRVLAGTGHRPNRLGGYGPEIAQRLVALAARELAVLEPTWVISGMALGWDQALAQAALDARIPFAAAIPFEGQESAWPAAAQERYRELRAAASWEVVVRGRDDHRGPREAMYARNRWMVDHATHVLALWDGGDGGTAHAVHYAERVGRPVTNVWERWAEAEMARARYESRW